MKINRLRLLGFKSFVEPTELVIEKGLTGVVGPNGCGKSNLLEALRWVMGETSYKSMRAAAMDDVIFSGTNTRPARNSAEVTIFIDNEARTAPAEFNGSDIIEITRRIEREAGSAYRINSSEVRARDVKILFEDAATGARSPALVRQGQIGEIVNAKPEQRRRILEDAAGVAGLHSRRHDAELRLRAAEANLARLSDILGQLNSQIESLKRQARQARRYKELSGEIRKSEAVVMYLSWTESQDQVATDEAALAEALVRLGQATEAEAKALRLEAERAEAIPPLREVEAGKAAALARLKIEQGNFEREAVRSANRQRELEARAAQFKDDIAREKALVGEAAEILERLDAEIKALEVADQTIAAAEVEAEELLDKARYAEAEAGKKFSELNARSVEAQTRKRSLETRLAERKEQAAKVRRQLTALETQTREIAAKAPDAAKLTQVQELGHRLAVELARLETATLAAEERVQIAAAEARAKREMSQHSGLAAREIETEVATLASILLPNRIDAFPPIVDSVSVAQGYEIALGAALGDDLDVPVAGEAPVHWRHVAPAPEDGHLPDGVEPLAGRVMGPKELVRRLMQVGVVDRAVGYRLQPKLSPGQRLVSLEGDLWRWDGFVASFDAPTAAAQRLAARNRLGQLEHRRAQAMELAAVAAAIDGGAQEALAAAEAELRGLRQSTRETQSTLAKAREDLTVIERAARETEGRLAAVREAKERAEESLVEAHEKIAETEEVLAHTDGGESLTDEIRAALAASARARGEVVEFGATVASLARERSMRNERLRGIAAECQRWQSRSEGANQHIATLEARQQETLSELESLAEFPARIEQQRQKLMTGLSRAEAERAGAADNLAAADNSLREAAQAMRAAQGAVASEREGRAGTEARLEAARARRSEEARKIRETLGVAPEACLTFAEIAPGAPLPSLQDIDRQMTRLKGDRERLGGVNLQADDELQALSQQYQSMDKERADVDVSINRLRGVIGQLNREAKLRLNEAFTAVNSHFESLFTTLFGGGEARLEMIEGEDPLEGGGLEIIAKPPGKKPTTLSLLSGGEQTLTALSLIFAVFLTNPSPICVLDEVDAPLDDANIDRFCLMMEKMAADTETRFLVITHHPMTMARMNRLFGVTMGERGVSQLVSVDLATAERIIEGAPAQQAASA